MSDIGVYTSQEVLEHKKRDGRKSDGRECFWGLPNRANVQRRDKFWIAVRGQWRGYFIVADYLDPEVIFHSDSWVDCSIGPRKPFQGFTYKVPQIPLQTKEREK
ncbi:MAG: hypothetical protein PHG80_11290 [Methanoregulaceae archaeon]|nr:hypothetical protein [Methanoregulaceae archaeon]